MRWFSLTLGIALGCALSPSRLIDTVQAEQVGVVVSPSYVRSGPGENYYPTDRLATGTRVVSYERAPGGWIAINPPAGSYCWVKATDVEPIGDYRGRILKESQPAVGSRFSIVRNVSQTKLLAGDTVQILAERQGLDSLWYKIAPPPGEVRWIQANQIAIQGQPEIAGPDTSVGQFSDYRDGAMRDHLNPPANLPNVPSHINLVQFESDGSFGGADAPYGMDSFTGLGNDFGLGMSEGYGPDVATASSGLSSTPYMIGDFFGAFPGVFKETQTAVGFTPNAGTGAIGRIKIAENTSPLPRTRVFVNYSYFDDVPLIPGNTNVQRLTPGLEKTFFGGRASFEVQSPMALTLSSEQTVGEPTTTDHYEFGNLQGTLKFILAETNSAVLAGGFSATAPTADDVRLNTNPGETVVKNEAVHLLPFFGGIYAPNERLFWQGFIQVDIDLNGNPIYVDGEKRAVLQDQTFLFVDLGMGYWLYRNDSDWRGLTGIVPSIEVHYNRSLQKADETGLFVGSTSDTIEIVNGVVGTTFKFGQKSWLTFGYAVPIGGGSDQQFDGEARAFFNRFF